MAVAPGERMGRYPAPWIPPAVALFLALQGCGIGTQKREPARPAVVSIADGQRGRLLYETACVACHTTEAHWRDKRLVRSWPDLVRQVTRWQSNAKQTWTGEEIVDVAAHLNERFYKLPCPVAGCGGPKEISQAGR
jgi:mono/diheme cytochrome c family protein